MPRPAEPRAESDLATAQARLTTRFGQACGSARPRTSAPQDWSDFAPTRSDNVPVNTSAPTFERARKFLEDTATKRIAACRTANIRSPS